MNKRIEWIDFGKGVTIMIVVLGHVVLGLLQSNRFLDGQNKGLLLAVEMTYVFHMPVFFALSGFFFKGYDNTRSYLLSMKSKMISLGVPYITFSIIMFIMKKIGESSVRNETSIKSLLSIYKLPMDHLWFLYTLMGIFLYVGFLSLVIKNSKVLFAISIIGFLIVNIYPVPIYLIQRTLVWLPLFMLGNILREIKFAKKAAYLFGLGYIIYISIWMLVNFKTRISYSLPGVWAIILPISVLLAFSVFPLFKKGKIYDYFIRCGNVSLPIYLIHVPVVSVTRIALFKVGVTNLTLHVVIGMLTGWFLTILLFRISQKIRFLDFFFYPIRYLR